MLPLALGIAFTFLFLSPSFGQRQCATVEYTEMLRNEKKRIEKDVDFEQWLSKKIQQRLKQKGANRILSTYQVPVVVHVIHNGESIGAGTNISNAQILSQIAVLNKDFNRLNTDAGNTPSEFLPVAGSMNIEFVMAKRTPEGYATNGIVRVQGSKTTWFLGDNELLKAQSYWPAEDYLNIWVCNLGGGYLGYTQFPVSNLPGLEDSPDNRLTDGIVIGHKYFGSIDDGPFTLDPEYNKGRTTTHEMGHFFGLRHIWGDMENCSGTDYVDDTPIQDGKTIFCPVHPKTTSCSTVKMFQNYLDYTDDECMNLFTEGQVERMTSVLENSPRRYSLLTSPGLLDANIDGNDLTISRIVAPSPVTCNTHVNPRVQIYVNSSTGPITSFKIMYSVNQGTSSTISVNDLNLAEGETIEVMLPQINLVDENTIAFEVREPNDGIDVNSLNNGRETTVIVNDIEEEIPLEEDFEQPLSDAWTITNPANGANWNTVALGGNTALYFNGFNNSTVNDQSWFVTPVLDFSNTSKASLFFDWSYAVRADKIDKFSILASTDCGFTFSEISNLSLSGHTSTQAWTPSSASDWSHHAVSLNDFAGKQNVRFAFVFTNGNGNNFYLDDINFHIPEKISIYPNPATDMVNVAFNLTEEENATIEIIDAMGKSLGEQTYTAVSKDVLPLSIGTLTPGVYLLRIRTTTQTWASKVMVVH